MSAASFPTGAAVPWGELSAERPGVCWNCGDTDYRGGECTECAYGARDEGLDMSGVWRRPATEYVPGRHRRDLVSIDAARYAHVNQGFGFDEKTCFVTGVRACGYFPEAYQGANVRGEVWFELVPEPNNPADPHALAIDLQGVRAGYVGANMASHYQWLIRAANYDGFRCFVPGYVETRDSVWIVLPTLKVIREVLDYESKAEQLRQLWDEISPEVQKRIRGSRYRLDEETASVLWQFRDRAPHLFPTKPDPEAFSYGWVWMFNEVRKEFTARREAFLAARRDAVAAEKEKRERDREAAKSERDQKIRDLYRSGASKASIARTVGTSTSTINLVLGIEQARGGENAWSSASQDARLERCWRALELQSEGATRRQIADQLGVGTETVKELLADGRFYRSPTEYPGRFRWATEARARGWSHAEGKERGAGATRAVRDANVLVKLGLMP